MASISRHADNPRGRYPARSFQTTTAPFGSNRREHASRATRVMNSLASVIRYWFTSPDESQWISPPDQYSEFSLLGVVPFRLLHSSRAASILQCSGTSPSHSMPDGFMGASGFRPLVTAWEMTAWRFSFSSSISRRCFVYQRVDFRRLAVEKVQDGSLLRQWRKRDLRVAITDKGMRDALSPRTTPQRQRLN